VLPRLRVRADIAWIVDTGADTSLLNPLDGFRLGVDYSQLTDPTIVTAGVGGDVGAFVEPALLTFVEPGVALHTYWIRLPLAIPRSDAFDLPSVLGRDVLGRWLMLHDPADDLLEFEVRSADVSISLVDEPGETDMG
jgi:hypothetical protein